MVISQLYIICMRLQIYQYVNYFKQCNTRLVWYEYLHVGCTIHNPQCIMGYAIWFLCLFYMSLELVLGCIYLFLAKTEVR